MKPGSIVKFHTPFPGENPDQTYVVLFVYPSWTQVLANGTEDTFKSRCDIKALNTGLTYPGVDCVLTEDLIEVTK